MVVRLWNKIVFVIILCMSFVGLSACQKEGKLNGLIIESSSVEFGSLQNSNDRELHFRVQVTDYGMEKELEYKIRFIIQDAYIRDVIGSERIEISDKYKTQLLPNKGAKGIITGSSIGFKKEFSVDEIRENIEKDGAVIVEIYDGNRIIDQEVVTNFKENIKPLLKINPNAKIEFIDLKGSDKTAIFSKAIRDWTKEEGISYIEYPQYAFNLGDESFYLWLSDEKGRIMNTKDIYTIYLLSNSSLKEIKEFIEKTATAP